MKALQGEGELLKQFKAELPRAAKFYVARALVTKSGMDLIQPLIERCLERGGRGCMLFGVDLPTEPVAIERLCTIQTRHKQNFELRRFQPGRTFFHPKLSIFVRQAGAKTAIVGSSNLTEGGLSTNYETNVFVDEHKVAQQLLDYFDEHFHGAHAKRIDQRWLDQYRQLWTERKKAEQRQRKLREKASSLGRAPTNLPQRIKGHLFAFTGKIADWPRETRLYPYVEQHGGSVAKRAAAMSSAECLVHAEILGGRRSTKKLMRAHQLKIPIITEEQFFKLAKIKHRAVKH
jgi:HKD family nuclease